MSRRDDSDPNDRLLKNMLESAQRLRLAGMAEAESFVTANRTLLDTLEEQAPTFADSLQRIGSRSVRRQRRAERGFRRRLRRHWGAGLDSLLVLVGVAEEAAGHCNARNREEVAKGNDVLFDVLYQMNGQACRLTREVRALLECGFPLGALARVRSLHEVSVRAQVLKSYGREPGHEDLAEKYALHHIVVNYRDALEFQRHAARLGYEPIRDEELSEMGAAHDELVSRYGSVYRSAYGWAAGLPGLPARPSFADLERLAQIDHLRGHYSWASHEVHADSKAMRLNVFERGGTSALLTGATNYGLADAGSLAAIYLHQTLASFLLCVDIPAHFDLFTLQAMSHLVKRSDEAFATAKREWKRQRRLSKGG